MNPIRIPDAAIKDFNRRYGHLLPKPTNSQPQPIDEDAAYIAANGLIDKNKKENK